MAKKDLTLDGPVFDSDLDFDFAMDDRPGFDQSSSNSKNRSVVNNVLRGARDGAKDTLKSPDFIRRTLEKSLPKTFGTITEGVDDIATGLYQLYDDASREVKPKLGSIARKIDQLVPENSKGLKKLSEKIMALAGERKDTDSSNAANQEEQAVTTMLASIFEYQQKDEKSKASKKLIDEAVDRRRFSQQTGILGAISHNLQIQTQYTTRVTSAYQKKTLELALRGYMEQKRHNAILEDGVRTMQAQLEGIVKNTGLPDFVKITNSEKFLEVSQQRFFNSLYGEGSFLRQGMERLKKTGQQMASGFGQRLSMADMGLDAAVSGKESIEQMNEMLVEMGEPPLTKAEMMGAAAGESLLKYLRDIVTERIKKKTEKNPKITENLAKLAKMTQNPAGSLQTLRESEDWQAKLMDYEGAKGKGYRFLDAFLEHFTDEKTDRSFKGTQSLDELAHPTMGFDHKAHLSLVDVIPGHLASIHREIAMLRTGKDAPLMTYDYERKQFVTRSEMGDRLIRDLEKAASSSSHGYRTLEAARSFEGADSLDETKMLELRRFMSRLSQIPDFDYLPENIRETPYYTNLSPDVRALVDKRLDTMDDNAPGKEVERNRFTESAISVKRSVPSFSKTLSSKVNAGYGELLAKKGVLKRNEDGNYEADDAALQQLLESQIGYKSDINVKESIKKLDPRELLKTVSDRFSGSAEKMKRFTPQAAYEGIKKTKLYDWFYQKGKGDHDPHAGPMAQDVRKNLGEETAPGGKKIDIQSMNGALMAAIQHLGKKIDGMGTSGEVSGGKGRGPSALTAIQRNTTEILKLLRTRLGRGRLSGQKGKDDASGGYGDLVGDLFTNVKDLAINVSKDVFDAANRVFSFGKDKVAKPTLDFITSAYNKNSDGIKDSLTGLFKKASDMAGSALDFGQKLLTEHLPAGLAQLKDLGGKAFAFIQSQLNQARDLYLPGGTEPIIRAIKLRAGFYRDAATGKVIKTMDELLSCKNDIVDEAGNVILSLEEKLEGLHDRYGEKVKTTAVMLGGAALDAASWMKDKVIDGFNALKDSSGSLLKRGKGLFKTKFAGFSMESGSKILKDSYQVQVDIRDILLGDADKVRERLHLLKRAALSADAADETTESASPAAAPPSEGSSAPRASLSSLLSTGQAALGKAQGLWGSAKDKLRGQTMGPPKPEVAGPPKPSPVSKAKGLLGGLKGKLGAAASVVGGGLSSLLSAAQTPEAQGPEVEGPPKPEVAGPPKPKKKTLKQRITGTLAAWNDKDGNGRRDGGVEDQQEKQEALAASRKKDPLAADLTQRYKPGSLFDMILGGLGKVFGLATSGLTGLFGLAGGLLSKLPGVGALVGGAVKGISAVGGLVSKGVGAVAKTGLSGVLGAARLAIPAALSAVGSVASAALSLGGAAVTSIAGVLASPVLLGVAGAALAGYGLWKLYQYATRDKVNEFERIRLRQYGFAYNNAVDRFNHHVYGLEAYLQDGRISYEDGKASLNDRKIKPEELCELFSIDKEDKETADKFSSWFTGRFKPVFLTHLTALVNIDAKKKLDEVEKLTPEQQLKYLQATTLESANYDLTTSPLKALPTLSAEREPVKLAINALIAKLQAKIKSDAKLPSPLLPAKVEAPRDSTKNTNDAAEKARQDEIIRQATDKNRQANAALGTMAGSGEDGPKPDVNLGADNKPPAAPGNLTVAGGAPLEGSGGRQYLKLGKDVDIDRLDPLVLKNLLGMAEEYGKVSGKSIQVNDGFRSYEQQAALYRQYPGKAAKPGSSQHEYGLAVDINSADADSLEKLGLMKKYGFTRPVGGETWHMEPAGVQRNITLARENPAEREKMITASLYRGGGGYGTDPSSIKSKRNHELAMMLLNVPGREIDMKKVEEGPTATASASSPSAAPSGASGSLGTASSKPTLAANDASIKPTSFERSQSDSTKAGLPKPRLVVDNTSSSNDDGEKKPTDSGGDAAVSGDVKEVISKNSKRAGVDPNIMLAFAAMESDFDPNAKASGGSASGLFGITNGTWREQLGKNASRYNLSTDASPFDPEASTLVASEYVKQNLQSLSSVKQNPNPVDAYLTHFLGPSGARKFLQADQNASGAEILPKAAAANGNIFYDKSGKALTVGQIYDQINKKMKAKANAYGISLPDSGMGVKPSSGEPGLKGGGLSTPSFSGATASPASSGGGGDAASSASSVGSAAPGTSSAKPSMASPASSNTGLFTGSRSTPFTASTRKESGETTAGPSMAAIESLLDKSYQAQSETVKVLKEILDNVKLEKVAEANAKAFAQAAKSMKPEESPKAQDDRNMGRSGTAAGSSLDMRRKSA